MKHRIVRHINQEVTEFYLWNNVFKEFQLATRSDFDDLPKEDFEYIELRHSMELNKLGFYGHVIKV